MSDNKPTLLYLVRHAEAEGNVYRRCHGHYNSLVTENGKRQIEALTRRFYDIPLDAVYSSDLYRAVATAEPVAREKGLAVTLVPALREVDMGCWEDEPWGLLPLMYPDEYDRWEKTPWACSIPGGESVETLAGRVWPAVTDIAAAEKGRSVAVFTHGAAIRVILCLAAGLPLEDIMSVGWCDNTAVALLEFGAEGGVEVHYKNDNSHLSDDISTYARQTWWKNKKDYNLSFRRPDIENDADRAGILEMSRRALPYLFGSLAEFSPEKAMDGIQASLAVSPDALVFAVHEGRDIGFALLDCACRRDRAGKISALYLEPEFRGQGIGAQLLGHAVSAWRARGKDEIVAFVPHDNAHALAFFNKNGFSADNSGARVELRMRIAVPPVPPPE